MQIPETPQSVQALDLMQRLKSYSEGQSTWHKDGLNLGDEARKACQILHTNVTIIVEQVLAPLMDRATARELETFTMHDRTHGLKVAHLMWHILPAERRQKLTPPEIGILVMVAFLHDVGMALSPEERQKRLAPESSLWDNLEIDSATRQEFEKLRGILSDKDALELQKRRAQTQLLQGEEVLLAVDTRERHATPERYQEVLQQITTFHENDKTRIPNVDSCMSYYGDSFREKLVDICVSHNQDSETLIERDKDNPHWLRFSHEFPVGDAIADLHMIAAALRIADILDFDRERTPPILFHYLVPGTLAESNVSAIEWTKHLTISNWHIEPSAIVFRGRSRSHITHHAVVQFCLAIQEELSGTHATFSGLGMREWPFAIPTFVKHKIHPEGYNYVQYRFELDDQRVYELLMGGAIYGDPRVALRELVQNSVDACKLRDSLMAIYEPTVNPDTRNRITVRYIEPSEKQPVPLVEVEDSGTGMDAWIIERFFLKVGQSYYRSSEFTRTRLQLRNGGCDFAPVSEFGIGFLSCFLLADRVDVETAMWESPRGDTRKRHLQIDGPTRLIQLREFANKGVARFKGTKIRLWLVRGARNDRRQPPTWGAISDYIRSVCQSLPYSLKLELVAKGGSVANFVEPLPLTVPRLPDVLESNAVRIPVNTTEMEGELVLVASPAMVDYRGLSEGRHPEYRPSDDFLDFENVLLRGGFSVGRIPGFGSRYANSGALGRVALRWQKAADRRYVKPNLARSASSQETGLEQVVFRTTMRYLLENASRLPNGVLGGVDTHWGFSGIFRDVAFLEEYDAYAIYLLGRTGWASNLAEWESGKTTKRYWSGGFSSNLLNFVLPRIVDGRVIQLHAMMLNPPVAGWREILQSWKEYVSEPVSWPIFAPFADELKGFLYRDGALNAAFAGRLQTFSQQKLEVLCSVILKLSGYSEKVFTSEDDLLLQEAIEKVGDAFVGDPEKCWPLRSFAKKQPSAEM